MRHSSEDGDRLSGDSERSSIQERKLDLIYTFDPDMSYPFILNTSLHFSEAQLRMSKMKKAILALPRKYSYWTQRRECFLIDKLIQIRHLIIVTSTQALLHYGRNPKRSIFERLRFKVVILVHFYNVTYILDISILLFLKSSFFLNENIYISDLECIDFNVIPLAKSL